MKLIWKYIKTYKKYLLINMFSAIGFVLIEIGLPTLLADAINVGFSNGDYNYVLRTAALMTVFAIVGLGGLIALAYSTNRIASGVIRDMRRDLFDKVQSFSHEEYEQFGVSRLITNTGNDPFQIMQFLVMALRTGIVAPMMFVASFIMILIKGGAMSIIIVAAVPLLCIGVYIINKHSEPLSSAQQSALDNINLNMRESLTGLRVIRAFNNQEFQEKRFDKVNSRYTKISKKLFRLISLSLPSFTIVFTLMMVAVLWFGAIQVDQLIIEYGTLAAFVEYIFHALFSFLMLAGVFMAYPRAAVSSRRIKRIFDAETTIDINPNGVTETKTQGYIEFKDVTFAYADNSQEAVIRNVSFTAEPGQTVAFIGSTGSGKSTLIQLIPRFFDVTSGEILIDGVNVKEYSLEALRKKIGYVPQKALLFSGTIETNLKFGNDKATMEEIKHAASVAQAKDFIESKPKKYEDYLAEGGINLSGGQKQRLSIARALVRKPAIYIFDDSFSALDYKTDATLRGRLKGETQQSTVLIVAQRVGTIMDADKILVIDQGEVVGIGTHKELLKRSSIYYEIASSQLSKEELGL